jgi:lipooligosaccharide transport system permease protein
MPRGAGVVYEHLWTAYRHTWRGTAVSGFLFPLLYLGALGGGVGHLVNQRQGATATLGGLSYSTFLVPGLLAATVAQTAFGEATWPVVAKVRWQRQYHAMVSAPLTVDDIVLGHAAWIATRLTAVSVVFVSIAACLGLVTSPLAVFAIPAAVLLGLAFTLPIMAFSVLQSDDQPFALLNRFVLVPLTLFSGTFFPVSQLPAWSRPIAWLTPLWHGSQLCREFASGHLPPITLLHLAYLGGLATVGLTLSRRNYARKLLV